MAKGPDAFRTISEAADEVGVPQHVLRFWETKFTFIRPMKRAGGRRFYRPQDLEVLRGIRVLLHEQGYTIKGVQKLHKDHGVRRVVVAGGGDPRAADLLERDASDQAAPPAETDAGGERLRADQRAGLEAVLHELEAAKARLDALLATGEPENS